MYSFLFTDVAGCLGKHRPKHDARTLSLMNYLRPGKLPAAPTSMDFWSRVSGWPMMENDKLGDCTVAAAGHMIQQWTRYSDAPCTPTDADVVAAYSAVSGYDPATGENDHGAAMLDVLNYWHKQGIGQHRILGYTGLSTNADAVREAIYLFGNVYAGFDLPRSAQQQLVWDVVAADGEAGSWGGHSVLIVGYDADGLVAVTWGGLKRLTWNFLDAYCDEAFAVLSNDFINQSTHVNPDNFDLISLQRDLRMLR
jgi:hypothetical protein